MFLKNSSTRSLALGALLLSFSALCLIGCGGSKPAEGAGGDADAKAGASGGAAPLAKDAGAAKDQQIQKEVDQEKGLKEQAGGGGGKGGDGDK